MIRDLWRTTGDAIVVVVLLALLGVATLVLHSWPAWGILAAMVIVVAVVITRWWTA